MRCVSAFVGLSARPGSKTGRLQQGLQQPNGRAWQRHIHRQAEDEDENFADDDDFSFPMSGPAVLIPAGPFCPFRSEFSGNEVLDAEMGMLSERAKDLTKKFAPIALDAQMGKMPDPATVRPLAQEMRETNDLYKVAMARMQYTEDFQGLEFFKMTEASLNAKGMTIDKMQKLMSWQMEGMIAFCENGPPPSPPEGMTEDDFRQIQANGPPMMGMFSKSQGLTAWPFDMDCKSMRSDVVREEFEKLSRDHEQLIKMGQSYGSFDAAGKEIFLDQVEDVETRWDIFLKRFQLTGELNPEYVKEAAEFLAEVGLKPNEFRKLLRDAHEIMRVEARRLS